MPNELKPCPFCGESELLDVQEVVRCSNCIYISLHSSGYYHCSLTGKEYKGYELGYNFCSCGKRVNEYSEFLGEMGTDMGIERR